MLSLSPNIAQQKREIVDRSSSSDRFRPLRIIPLPMILFSAHGGDAKKKVRKYYGKRVKSLIKCNKTSSNRNKALRTVFAKLAKQNPCPSKYIKDLNILYSERIDKDKKTGRLLNSIAQYKKLVNLIIELPESLIFSGRYSSLYADIRKLNQLQSLNIILSQSQVVEHSKHLSKLKSLRSLSLRLTKITSEKKPDQAEFFNSCTQFIRSKSLQSFNLTVEFSRFRSPSLNTFLQEIGQSNLPAFKIKLPSLWKDMISTEALNSALKKAELLAFSTVRTNEIYFICGTNDHVSLSKAKRIIELYLDSRMMPRQSWSHTSDSNDQSLVQNLKYFFPDFEWFQIMPEIGNTARIKKLSLCFPPGYHYSAHSTLLRVLKEANTIEYLTLAGLNEISLSVVRPLFAEISNLQSLTCLELLHLSPDHLSTITENLKHLKNLKRLQLDMNDFPLKFPENSQLTDLSISLPKYSSNLNSKEDFINAIGELKDLQKLNLFPGTILFEEKKSRRLLMETLFRLTQLREIYIHDIEENRFTSLTQSEIEQHKELTDELRDYTQKLFKEKPDLEKVYFSKPHAYEIRYYRY